MKAKEYAVQLLQRQEALVAAGESITQAQIKSACETAVDVLEEVRKVLLRVRSDASGFGAYREGLTKWKSIVNSVKSVDPEHPITVNYLGLFIATSDVKIFELLIANKVFLGYEFSVREEEILNKLRAEREQERNSRIASLFFLGSMLEQRIRS